MVIRDEVCFAIRAGQLPLASTLYSPSLMLTVMYANWKDKFRHSFMLPCIIFWLGVLKETDCKAYILKLAGIFKIAQCELVILTFLGFYSN